MSEAERLREAGREMLEVIENTHWYGPEKKPSNEDMNRWYDALAAEPDVCEYTRHHYDDPELSYDYFVTSCGHEVHEVGQKMTWETCPFKGCGSPIKVKDP